MHDMSSNILHFPEGVGVPPPGMNGWEGMDAQARAGRTSLNRCRESVQAQIGFMRARGMSNTGIRRVLGLSEREAVDAGIIPSRVEADRKDRLPASPGHVWTR